MQPKSTDNPDFIPGIFNYCDRWCERCPFTNRCRLVADELEYYKETGNNPYDPEELVTYISHQFDKALEMLKDAMQKHGIDPNDIEPTEEELAQQQAEKEKAREHPMVLLSMTYFDSSGDFMKAHPEWLETIDEEMVEEPARAVPFSVSDALDTINWYHGMVPAKANRVIHNDIDPGFDDPIQNDKNGSAKVLSICLKNSIGAWSHIMEHTPSLEDECITHLAMLQKILKMLDKEAPDYPQFIRPGFDDGSKP